MAMNFSLLEMRFKNMEGEKLEYTLFYWIGIAGLITH